MTAPNLEVRLSPRVVAHRGARWLAVENTLEALRIAFEEGATGVEFDVQLTRDGELVLFHDDTLTALTGRDGRVVDLDWRTLRDVPLRDRHGHVGRIPHLNDIIELLAERPALINLELKVVDHNGRALADAVVAALDRAGQPSWLLSSFDRAALTRLKSCDVALPRALLIDDDSACAWWSSSLPDRGADALAQASEDVGGHLVAIHPHGRLVSAERMTLWREAGMRVHVWTLNGPVPWAAAVRAGVDAVITDDPGGMAAWLAGEGLG